MNETKKISEIQERIVALYLRLNGYFQSGLIIHSQKWGENYGEIDRLALRMKNHSQLERQTECDEILRLSDENIDFIIAEVKNSGIEFNKSLIDSPKAEFSWYQIASWSGIFNEAEIDEIVEKGQSLVSKSNGTASELIFDSETFGKIRIRPIFFSFDEGVSVSENQYLVINGDQVIDYIYRCFDPIVVRETCSTAYPYTAWGTEFSDIVETIKNRIKAGEERLTASSLVVELSQK